MAEDKDAYDEDLNPNLKKNDKRAVADISGSGSFVSNNPMNFFAMKAEQKWRGFKQKRAEEKELKLEEKNAYEEEFSRASHEKAIEVGKEKAQRRVEAKFNPENKPINRVVRGFGKIASGTENLLMKGGRIAHPLERQQAEPSAHTPQTEFHNPAVHHTRELKDRFVGPTVPATEGGASSLLEGAFFGVQERGTKTKLTSALGGHIGDEFSKGGRLFGAMAETQMGPRPQPQRRYRARPRPRAMKKMRYTKAKRHVRARPRQKKDEGFGFSSFGGF